MGSTCPYSYNSQSVSVVVSKLRLRCRIKKQKRNLRLANPVEELNTIPRHFRTAAGADSEQESWTPSNFLWITKFKNDTKNANISATATATGEKLYRRLDGSISMRLILFFPHFLIFTQPIGYGPFK